MKIIRDESPKKFEFEKDSEKATFFFRQIAESKLESLVADYSLNHSDLPVTALQEFFESFLCRIVMGWKGVVDSETDKPLSFSANDFKKYLAADVAADWVSKFVAYQQTESGNITGFLSDYLIRIPKVDEGAEKNS